MAYGLGSRALSALFKVINVAVPWHRLPASLGVFNLLAFRNELRAKNLHSTRGDAIPTLPSADPNDLSANPDSLPSKAPDAADLARRAWDGKRNDLVDVNMGAAHTRFGRNMPLNRVFPAKESELMEPSPRVVANRLLARAVGPDGKPEFVPAKTLNLLAASWIQFMTHDWFHHGEQKDGNEFSVPLDTPKGDTWQGQGCPMRVRRTPKDPSNPGTKDYPPTYLNDGSHWWDGSQVYGNNEADTRALRCHDYETVDDGTGKPLLRHGVPVLRDARGELRVTKTGLLPTGLDNVEQAGLVDNWWIGLSMLHTLFAQEHNAVAARLRASYPQWDGDRIFQVARLVNVALMAKIHTVEWTTAILGHPALQIAMNANWWGLVTERITKVFGRLTDGELMSGIPGSEVDQHGCPYSLTEEFVSVYRLHPLMPDSLRLHRAVDGKFVREMSLPDLVREKARNALTGGSPDAVQLDMDDLFYSFGVCHPGAISLHNYPAFLRNFARVEADGTTRMLDLATIDVLRDRERGVPRYNDFRELIHRGRVSSFEQITSNKEWAAQLREVYGHVDKVDLMVGMFAEDLPEGFGFSDTAFRVFILMASRRIKSDRFFTTDFNENIYTRVGLDWINNNDMRSLILRHFPRVAPALRQMKNAFAPWPVLTPGGGWEEEYLGGSRAREEAEFVGFQKVIHDLQKKEAERGNTTVKRGFHAKSHYATSSAQFEVLPDVPEDLRMGVFIPGAKHRASVRFSNSVSNVQRDKKLQGRGIGIRVHGAEGVHDLLLSNSPTSHARDARQFMAVAEALAGPKLLFFPKLIASMGLVETVRTLKILIASGQPVSSLATEHYWSRTPYAFGPCAVKFMLAPRAEKGGVPTDDLRDELLARLRREDVEFTLYAIRYVDAARTPLEDGRADWKAEDSPPVSVAVLRLPRAKEAPAAAEADTVNAMAFTPWNTTGGVVPLGSLNRSRKPVYQASAALRGAGGGPGPGPGIGANVEVKVGGSQEAVAAR